MGALGQLDRARIELDMGRSGVRRRAIGTDVFNGISEALQLGVQLGNALLKLLVRLDIAAQNPKQADLAVVKSGGLRVLVLLVAKSVATALA